MPERVRKLILLLTGILFLGGLVPIAMFLFSKDESQAGIPMLMILYVVLGIFLLLAAPAPAAHRSLIAYAAWANLAHGAIMAIQMFEFPGMADFRNGAIMFVAAGALLLTAIPPKQPARAAMPA